MQENNLQKESDKRTIVCDDKLRKVFKVKEFTAFNMNKFLKDHFLGKAEGKDAERGREVAARLQEEDPPKAKSASGSSTKKSRTGSSGGGGGGGGFQKELPLSSALAKVVGVSHMSRPQAVKAVWAYIRVCVRACVGAGMRVYLLMLFAMGCAAMLQRTAIPVWWRARAQQIANLFLFLSRCALLS